MINIFNWTMFVRIMVSLCKHTQKMSTSKPSGATNAQDLKKIFIATVCLGTMLGLGWGFGLAATSSDMTELTFSFQVVFSIFVGSQGVLIFIFHGLRNDDFRNFWKLLYSESQLLLCKFNNADFKSSTGKSAGIQDSVAP